MQMAASMFPKSVMEKTNDQETASSGEGHSVGRRSPAAKAAPRRSSTGGTPHPNGTDPGKATAAGKPDRKFIADAKKIGQRFLNIQSHADSIIKQAASKVEWLWIRDSSLLEELKKSAKKIEDAAEGSDLLQGLQVQPWTEACQTFASEELNLQCRKVVALESLVVATEHDIKRITSMHRQSTA